jgi:hypothetical protein
MKQGMKWNLLVEHKYHYWSSLDFIVAVQAPELKAAEIRAQFECQWFGLYLKKVEIARGDLYLTPWIDITDDFLSGSMKKYRDYLDQNPLPKEESEYLPTNTTPEKMAEFLSKKANETDLKQNQKSKDRVELELALIRIVFSGITIIGLWLIRKRFRINKRVRLWLIIELLGLPVLVGILIVSMVLADPIGTMPKSFGLVYSLNGFLALFGCILYIIHIVSIRKRFRQIAYVISTRMSES